MEAFVTGGTGFVGRALIEALLEQQWQVRALVRSPARAGLLPPEVTVIGGDLADEKALLEGARGADVAFHLGAATSGSWETHAESTVEGTRRMLQACHAENVRRFILVSSIVVYDKRGKKPDATVEETAPLLVADPAAGAYARGKIEAESLAGGYSRSASRTMDIVIVRPGLIYSRERLAFPHLGELIGRTRIASGGPGLLLPLVELGSCVDALLRVATDPATTGKTYNVVDAHCSTRRDYLEALSAATGYRQRVMYLPAWPLAAAAATYGGLQKLQGKDTDVSAAKLRARSTELRYDTARLQRDTGWQPLRELREGLARAGVVAARTSTRDVSRVGLVGAGMIAPAHVRALQGIPGTSIVGICDSNMAAAKALAAQAGEVPVFDDPERFYREAQPQIVHVLTPPHTHALVAREALRRGAHVLLEKPAATTLEECDDMLAAARIGDLTVGVDETVAWDPMVRRGRAALLYGILGDLVHVDVFMSSDLSRSGRLEQILRGTSAWEHRLVGGPLEDLLPHPLSVVRALCGPMQPEYFQSRLTGRLPCDFPDELRMVLGNGTVTAHIEISLTARPDDFVLAIRGTRATLRIDVQNMHYDCVTPLPGPRAAVRGARAVRSAARMFGQTFLNGVAVLFGALPPASPVHLIREHHAALARGEPPPAPLAAARGDIAIARSLWPAPAPTAADTERRNVVTPFAPRDSLGVQCDSGR